MYKLTKALEREHNFTVLENDKFEFFHNSIFLNIVDVQIERLSTGEIYYVKNYNIETGSFKWPEANDDDDVYEYEDEDDYGLISPIDEEECEVCLSAHGLILIQDSYDDDSYLLY